MRTRYLPASEIYLAHTENTLKGFVALVSDYLAAIFVLPQFQGKGIGRLLLEEAKKHRQKLSLKVYKKNAKSLRFYKSNGFALVSENIDETTGETELLMEWNAPPT